MNSDDLFKRPVPIVDGVATFKNFAELMHLHKFTADSWINDEMRLYTRKSYYDSLKVIPYFIPKDLSVYSFRCDCGYCPDYDFLMKKTPPSTCIEMNPGFIKQTHYKTFCPQCEAQISIPTPQFTKLIPIDFYADEAERVFEDSHFYIYTIVCFNGSVEERKVFESYYFALKKVMSKGGNSADWVFHMKELTTGESLSSPQSPVVNDRKKVNELIRQIIELIGLFMRTGKIKAFVSVAATSSKQNSVKGLKNIKDKVQIQNLVQCIHSATSIEICPFFYYERSGTDGALKNFIAGARCTLAWPFVTHGIPIRTPQFVLPEFHYMLEIADILSYVIGRALYEDRAAIRPNQFNVRIFGNITYLVGSKTGWKPFISDTPPKYNFSFF